MKHLRISLFIGFIAFLAFTMSGCVFIRLLKVKLQMQKFDRYFRIEDQGGGVTLIFLEPVMLMKDIEWLMRSRSIIQASNGRYALWKYVFKKQYPHAKTEKGNFDIAMTMFFENEKLYKARYPKKFSSILGQEFITEALKSMGTGKIDKKQRSISAAWKDKNEPDAARIPTKPDVEKVLGQPFFINRSDAGFLAYYKYTLQNASPDQIKKPAAGRLWLTYRYGDGRLLSAKSKINGMTLLLDLPET